MTAIGLTTINSDAKLQAGGSIVVDQVIDVGTGNVLLATTGNLTQTAQVRAFGLGLLVEGNTTLQHPDNKVTVLAANNGGFTYYRDFDALTVGTVTVDGMTAIGLTTINSDAKLQAGGSIVVDQVIDVGTGNVLLATTGNLTQTASIVANGLGLMIDGNTTLQHPANNVNIFAANNGGTTLFRDLDGVTVGTVTVDGMTAIGLTTNNSDTKIQANGNLAINQQIDAGTGNVMLVTTGDLTQTAPIRAVGLGLLVDGNSTLQHPDNKISEFAANNGGFTYYRDFDALTVGSVTVAGMTATGLTTVNSDAKLQAGGSLAINQQLNVGIGNLMLVSTGNVTQIASVIGNGLGLMIDGNTTLQHPANNVTVFAANNGGQTLYRDIDGVIVGSVIVDGMTTTGLTTNHSDAKVQAGGNIAINQQIDIGTGNLMLVATVDLTQTARIHAFGLGLMVDGATILQHPQNNITVFAANNGDLTFYRDFDSLIVGTVSVDGMTAIGLTTLNSDAKLHVGGDLVINQSIDIGVGNLMLVATGNVSQTASIVANGLGLIVDGNATLQHPNNNVNILAANNGGQTLYRDVDGVIIGSVTVDGMTVTGLTTNNSDVKLQVAGNLVINQQIELGTGNLMLVATGDLTQTARIRAFGLGLMVDGVTLLQHPQNNVTVFAANNGDLTFYQDFDSLIVGSITVDGMTAIGLTTINRDAKLQAGGDIAIHQPIEIGFGNLMLVSTGNVTQVASIRANGLGLMVDGNTRLQHPNNNVSIFAANNGGWTYYRDYDALTVGVVTVDGMTATGLTTNNSDAKLQAGGNLALSRPVHIGTGNLMLISTGNVTQSASIRAHGLGLIVDQTTTLLHPDNHVSILATQNLGATRYRDVDDLTIGNLVVDGTQLDQVFVDSSMSLILGGTLTQQSTAPMVVTGLTELTVGGNICLPGGTFAYTPPAQNDNDWNTLRIHSAQRVDLADKNDLTVELANASQQIRFAAGDTFLGRLTLAGNISAPNQILLQASNGISQLAGQISTHQLMLGGTLPQASTGVFDLQQLNKVDQLSAQIRGDLHFTNSRNLEIAAFSFTSVCDYHQVLAGVTVLGNLSIWIDGNVGGVAGNLTQANQSPVIVGGTTTLDVSGNIVLLGDDRDPSDGGNHNDFGGTVSLNTNPALNGANRNFIELADINDLHVVGALANQGIHLYAGTNVAGLLELDGNISANQVLLQSSGGTRQQTTSRILAQELLVGGNRINEGTGSFEFHGPNEVQRVAANLLNGSLQLRNQVALTVAAGIHFVGSDGATTDQASGLHILGTGANLIFSDPNLALAATAQGAIGNANQQIHPVFARYLSTNDIGIAIVNAGEMIIETGARVYSAKADIYLETNGQHDLRIKDTIRIETLTSRMLVVAGGELRLEPHGRLERGSAGLITSRYNDLILEDPTGNPADQNRLVDRNRLTQNLRFAFGDHFESNFDAAIFWGLVGISDNSFNFQSLTSNELAALEQLLFGGGTPQYQSRSFYELFAAATGVTLTSQPIGGLFDNSGTQSDIGFVPTASFTLDFLRNNAEFRNLIVLFNDSNINLFQHAATNLEDLNVATADFTGLARFNVPARIMVTRPEPEVFTRVEIVQLPEFDVVQQIVPMEDLLVAQNVQEKFFVVVYFPNQYEADLFEARFGADERDFEEVIQILKSMSLENSALEWKNAASDEINNLDANEIREILNRAGIDLAEQEAWTNRLKGWLAKPVTENQELPDLPRGVFKILEVDNGKTVIQGDDIDRKFVPIPSEKAVPGDSRSEEPASESDLEPERKAESPLGIPEDNDLTSSPLAASPGMLAIVSLMSQLQRQRSTSILSGGNQRESQSGTARTVAAAPNPFSSASRFRRRMDRLRKLDP
jgi:hypothetical protein